MKVNDANTETFFPPRTQSGDFRATRAFLAAVARGPERSKNDFLIRWFMTARGRDRDAINLLVALLIDQVQSCHSAAARLAESHAIDDANKPAQLRETEMRKFRDNYRHG